MAILCHILYFGIIIFILWTFLDYYFHIMTLMGALLGPGPGPWALLGRARTMGPMGRARTMGLWAQGQDHAAGDVCGGR